MTWLFKNLGLTLCAFSLLLVWVDASSTIDRLEAKLDQANALNASLTRIAIALPPIQPIALKRKKL